MLAEEGEVWSIQRPDQYSSLWRVNELEFPNAAAAAPVSYTAQLDVAAAASLAPPYELSRVWDENLILALSCATRPWPALSSKQEIARLEEELDTLCASPLTPPFTTLEARLSCGVRIRAEIDAPGYVGLDGTAAQLVWGEQPASPGPVSVRVTLSLN